MPKPYAQSQINRNLVNKRGKTANSNGLPGKIRCRLCKTEKSTIHDFSKTQLRPYQPSVHNPNPKIDNIKAACKSCTGQQTTELTCLRCDNTKPLDKFAKRQRKDPERATCELCMQKIGDTEPDVPMPDSDDYSEEESEEESDFDGVPNGVSKGKQREDDEEEEDKEEKPEVDPYAHFYRSKK